MIGTYSKKKYDEEYLKKYIKVKEILRITLKEARIELDHKKKQLVLKERD